MNVWNYVFHVWKLRFTFQRIQKWSESRAGIELNFSEYFYVTNKNNSTVFMKSFKIVLINRIMLMWGLSKIRSIWNWIIPRRKERRHPNHFEGKNLMQLKTHLVNRKFLKYHMIPLLVARLSATRIVYKQK